MKSSGIVLFHRVFDKKYKPELFGMLMSALDSFAKELSEAGFNSFEFDNKRYSIKKANKYLFVASSSPKHRMKKVNQEMMSLAKSFFEIYDRDLLDHFDGDTSVLKSCEECFKAEIQDSLEEPVKKFWEGIIKH
ncbi:MAG: hypothetical protein GF353_13100 [Candidatus Lokiarchaeota archaeon]|nr:hypothetical protein [Candidatus Lokiarchaeota archaeon]